MENKDWYNKLKKSQLNPPNWVFSVVWPILYALMINSLILVWNDNSPWHMEPGETDANILKNIQSNIRQNKWWGPWWRVSTTVCNFRLLGDDKNSTIHFADITDEFYETILNTRQKFYDKWTKADGGFFVSAVNDENFPTFSMNF